MNHAKIRIGRIELKLIIIKEIIITIERGNLKNK